jgi:hypothetical protein
VHFVTAVRLQGGEEANSISHVRWLNAIDGVAGTSSIAAIVDWMEKGNPLYVGSSNGKVRVGVVRPTGKAPHIRAYANRQWVDNLLELPRF